MRFSSWWGWCGNFRFTVLVHSSGNPHTQQQPTACNKEVFIINKYSCEEDPLGFLGSAFSGFFSSLVYITRKVFAGGFQDIKNKSYFGKKIGFRPYRFLGTLGQL